MKVLVYDGDCSMCRGLSRLLVRRCLTGDTVRRAFDDFEGETAARLRDAGIHNEMAVMDRESGEIRSGFAGILWVAREGAFGWLAALLSLPGLRHVMTFFYRLVAYNRRVLAPVPPRGVACACDPDPRPVYQWSFIVLCIALASGLWWPLALCLAVVIALLSLVRNRPMAPDVLAVMGHLAWVMLVSMIPVYLSVLCNMVWDVEPLYGVGFVLGIATTAMLAARRSHLLGFGLLRVVVTPFCLWGVVGFAFHELSPAGPLL